MTFDEVEKNAAVLVGEPDIRIPSDWRSRILARALPVDAWKENSKFNLPQGDRDYAVALNIGIKQGITIAEGQVKRVSPGQFNTILEKISGSGNVDVSRARLQRERLLSALPLADGTESHALIVSSDAYIRGRRRDGGTDRYQS